MTLSRKDKFHSHSEAPRAVKNKQRAIKTSFSVVITIVVCFLPWFFVLPLIDSLACSLLRQGKVVLYVMFFLSSVINPLVCMLCVQSFRKRIDRCGWILWVELKGKNLPLQLGDQRSRRPCYSHLTP